MLRITGWSLLLGTAALIAGLLLFYTPPGGDKPVPALAWNAATGKVIAGEAATVDGNTRIALNKVGMALINLPMEPVAARDYAFLHLALEESPEILAVVLTWTNSDGDKGPHTYAVESTSRTSLWIATAELPGWTGDIGSLSLMILGKPGGSVVVRDFSIVPSSRWRQLQALYSDATAYEPWNRAAMNTYTGVTNVSSFYPVPLAAALFLLSLAAYGAVVAASRGKVRFNRATVALIFLASWIILDLSWQYRLVHQVKDTVRTFAGVDASQRQAVGPDAELFKFASQIKPKLAAPGARVFVASSDHYNGMRVAYYLYPLNVYWSVHAPEVPYDEFLRSGDFIALINPTVFRYYRHRNVLSAPDRADLPVELVYAGTSGILLRLN